MTENSTPGPWYLGHFSDEAAGAVYVIRVTTDPLLALRAFAVLEREVARVMQFAARDARAQGATWNDVAEALQVSRQSAHARFAAAAAEPEPEAPARLRQLAVGPTRRVRGGSSKRPLSALSATRATLAAWLEGCWTRMIGRQA